METPACFRTSPTFRGTSYSCSSGSRFTRAPMMTNMSSTPIPAVCNMSWYVTTRNSLLHPDACSNYINNQKQQQQQQQQQQQKRRRREYGHATSHTHSICHDTSHGTSLHITACSTAIPAVQDTVSVRHYTSWFVQPRYLKYTHKKGHATSHTHVVCHDTSLHHIPCSIPIFSLYATSWYVTSYHAPLR